MAKAVIAKALTKLGIMEATRATRDSAAKRPRTSHMIHMKKLCAIGLRLASQ